MSSPLVLAFDPGPEKTAYAIVRAGAKPRCKQAGVIGSTLKDVEKVLLCADIEGAVFFAQDRGGISVAVETPAGYVYSPGRGPDLVETATVAGGIAWLAESRRYDVHTMPAGDVRRALVGRSRLGFRQREGDMDRFLAQLLPGLVEGMPKRTNNHVRDALALAVVVGWGVISRRRAS